MDIKVTRFGYGWAWVGFFAISRPRRSQGGPAGAMAPPKSQAYDVCVYIYILNVV
jgi:hypothetical protein